MHLFGTAGLVSFCAGCLLNIYVLFDKLMGATIAGRPLLFLGLLLTVAGIQLITTGFLADLMMRTYYESQNKKPYRIKRSTGAQAFQQEVESSLAAPVIDLPDRFRPSKS